MLLPKVDLDQTSIGGGRMYTRVLWPTSAWQPRKLFDLKNRVASLPMSEDRPVVRKARADYHGFVGIGRRHSFLISPEKAG